MPAQHEYACIIAVRSLCCWYYVITLLSVESFHLYAILFACMLSA